MILTHGKKPKFQGLWAGPTVAVWRTTQTLIIGCNVSSGGSKKCKPETGVEILKSAGASAGATHTHTVPSRVTGKPRGFKSISVLWLDSRWLSGSCTPRPI